MGLRVPLLFPLIFLGALGILGAFGGKFLAIIGKDYVQGFELLRILLGFAVRKGG